MSTSGKSPSTSKPAVSKPAAVRPAPVRPAVVKPAPVKPAVVKSKTVASTATTTVPKPINITKEKIRVTTNPAKITDAKKLPATSTRLTLSQRFNEFESEAKRKRVEEPTTSNNTVLPAKSGPVESVKPKTKTLFTIHLPSKQPGAIAGSGGGGSTVTTANPKPTVTVVPAQGKALNRNHKSASSIFDRLDAQSSSSTAMSLLKKDKESSPQQGKKNVFKRLGTKEDSPTSSSNSSSKSTGSTGGGGSRAHQKVQIVPPMQGSEHSAAKSVFNRLGDR